MKRDFRWREQDRHVPPYSHLDAMSRNSAAISPDPVVTVKRSVMIIEDDPLIAHHLATLLEDLDFLVCAFADSKASAVSKAREQTLDLILADIQLRGIGDGISAVQEIWEQHFIPVVFVTGNREELIRRGMGHLAVVGKPFVPSALKQAVRVALSDNT